MDWKIYKITNLVNQKIYIGITMNELKIRWKNHVGSKKCPVLNAAIKKYGAENFSMETIDSAGSLEEALRKETEYIKQFNSLSKNGKGYNVTEFTEAFLYSQEVKNKMITTRKERKLLLSKSRGQSSKFIGVSYNNKYKFWEFQIRSQKEKHTGDRYASEEEAVVARDVKLFQVFDKESCLILMNFPENYERYLSGEIKTPERSMKNGSHKKNFKFVYFYKRDSSWRAAVFKNQKIIASKGCFDNEKDAAEFADYLNIQYLQDESKLNFPEKRNDYLRQDYTPPLTIHEKNLGSPFPNISYSGAEPNFYFKVNISSKGVRFFPVFRTLKEAIIARNEIIQKHNLKPPIDRPELIKLKNLDPKIWSLEE